MLLLCATDVPPPASSPSLLSPPSPPPHPAAASVAELPPRSLLPRHLAVIMDGNSRWAASRGLPTADGHAAGVVALRALVTECTAIDGVRELSVFAFSEENWRRPPAEVDALLALIEHVLVAEADALFERGVRLRFVGDLQRLPASLQRLLERMTARAPPPEAESLLLCVALSYGGRQELARAARELAERAVAGELAPNAIDEHALRRAILDSPQSAPSEPDLLIRTGAASQRATHAPCPAPGVRAPTAPRVLPG